MSYKSKNGFTLIEILVVTAILALLAAIAIPNFMRSRLAGNESAAKTTLKSISSALENYYSINNKYPADTSALLGAAPPYLNKNYFSGTSNGYTFTSSLTDYSYLVTASPVSSSTGTTTYTISTGSILGSQ
jgi:prepilin-type N-terminal cleavage/methylation domain-containing protein